MSQTSSLPDQSQLADLTARIRGDVKSDIVSRGIYATDASHYQIVPSVVVVPRDDDDVVAALQWAKQHSIPITPRGGGTSLSGQTTWSGMVLDLSKYMNQVLEVNAEQAWVRAQAGLVRDELNAQLAKHGLYFGPDPATGNRATVGGMVGNNTSGTRSIIHGRTVDNVEACRVALADGTIVELQSTSRKEWLERESQDDRLAEIYRGVRTILERERQEITRRFPKVMRRVGGYNLDAFPDWDGEDRANATWNPAHLIVGSEGTLAVLLDARLRLYPVPGATALCVVNFDGIVQAMEAVDPILEFEPSAVELLDSIIVRGASTNPSVCRVRTREDLFADDPPAVLIIEFSGEDEASTQARAQACAKRLAAEAIGTAWPIASNAADQKFVWTVRKAGLGLLANAPGRRKSQAFIEDACVPTDKLAKYIEQVMEICDKHGVESGFYAHASVGVIHVRPKLDMHDPQDVQKMKDIAYEVFPLVMEYGGSWSGEHGDGLVRGEFVPRFFGERIYEAFRQVKGLFDPEGRMNPGKIVDSPSMTENLRYSEAYQPSPPETAFHYRDHGGLVQAVEQCVGVGLCRKTGGGTMCPSYMATRDEEHSTRGRANALRMAISGQLGPDAVTGDRLHEVLGLCLSCKACKSECPTAVDVARMKSDVLAQRYAKLGTPRSAKLLGRLPKYAAKFAGGLAWLFNGLPSLPGARMVIERLYGVDRRRPLPKFASETFATWWAGRTADGASAPATKTQVTLFVDTFTNYFEPRIGKAAVKFLEGCGYQVQAAMIGCCQRPQISQGLLAEAKTDGAKTLAELAKITAGPIVVLEPSCASALVDDLPDLLDESQSSTNVASCLERIQPLEVFLAGALERGELSDVRFSSPHSHLLVHGHCHQKALFGTDPMKTIFETLDGTTCEEVDSGCCGMAGSFGYEHFELSQKIGEDRLFPAVRDRDSNTQVVACGISCRHQLHDFLDTEAQHWVEVVTAERTGA